MDELIPRIGRAVILGSVTFASGYVITGNLKTASALGLVPFVLNCAAVLSEVGYLVTGVAFLVAIAVSIFGHEWIDTGQRLVETVVQRADESLSARPQTAPSSATEPKVEAKPTR